MFLCWSAGLTGELCAGPDGRPALRGLGLSRAEDLRAELLRAEHLKAEALWEENSDGSRQDKTNILNSAPKVYPTLMFLRVPEWYLRLDVNVNAKTILPSSGHRKHYLINHCNTVNNHTNKSASQLH